MLFPTVLTDNLFDRMFDFPQISDFWNEGRGFAANMLKTDIREHDDKYELDIDMPGFAKEDVNIGLQNGYLTVSAEKKREEKKEKDGKVIRQERYTGKVQRSFYVGEGVTEEDIKAKMDGGVLKLDIAKKEAPAVPEKKQILIEG